MNNFARFFTKFSKFSYYKILQWLIILKKIEIKNLPLSFIIPYFTKKVNLTKLHFCVMHITQLL